MARQNKTKNREPPSISLGEAPWRGKVQSVTRTWEGWGRPLGRGDTWDRDEWQSLRQSAQRSGEGTESSGERTVWFTCPINVSQTHKWTRNSLWQPWPKYKTAVCQDPPDIIRTCDCSARLRTHLWICDDTRTLDPGILQPRPPPGTDVPQARPRALTTKSEGWHSKICNLSKKNVLDLKFHSHIFSVDLSCMLPFVSYLSAG